MEIHPQMVIFHRKTHRKMVVLWELMGFSHGKTMTGWWLKPTPLKNMSSSVGIMTFPVPIYGKIEVMYSHVPGKPPTSIVYPLVI